MIISYSSQDPNKANVHNKFLRCDVRSSRQLIDLITRYVWSPIVWKNDRRHNKNFLFATMCSLDFDDGTYTLASAKQWLISGGYKGIIGTTKSHQKEKNGVVCDRFRMLIPFNRPCYHAYSYTRNLKEIIYQLSADPAPCDTGRMFFPCKDIYFATDGEPLEWYNHKPPIYKPSSKKRVATGDLPGWVKQILNNGVPEGGRNNMVFKLTCRLYDYGYLKEEALDMILRSNISISDEEKQLTVTNAYTFMTASRPRVGGPA